MDNAYTQSMVAYEEGGPKELYYKHGLHDGNKQFGNGSKMPQSENILTKVIKVKVIDGRHKEYR